MIYNHLLNEFQTLRFLKEKKKKRLEETHHPMGEWAVKIIESRDRDFLYQIENKVSSAYRPFLQAQNA